MFCKSEILIFIFAENNYSIYAHTMLIKTPLLHQSFGPCVLLSLSLPPLFFRLIPWSAEALWVHFPAWASKTLWRRHSAPSPHWEGTWGLREQSKPHEGAFCFNQGISASFSLLCFLIGQLWTTRFWSIKGPQQQRVGHDWAHTWTPNFKFFKVIPVLIYILSKSRKFIFSENEIRYYIWILYMRY